MFSTFYPAYCLYSKRRNTTAADQSQLLLLNMGPRRREEPPAIEVSEQTKADFAKVVFDNLQKKLDKKNARYDTCSVSI